MLVRHNFGQIISLSTNFEQATKFFLTYEYPRHSTATCGGGNKCRWQLLEGEPVCAKVMEIGPPKRMIGARRQTYVKVFNNLTYFENMRGKKKAQNHF